MEINKKLLRKVRNHILAELRRYEQGTPGKEVTTDMSPCGTRACIGGWADILEGGDVKHPYQTNLERARKKLGFTKKQAHIVFFSDWPEEFDEAWKDNIPRERAARLAANYINYIIRTGKVT